MRSRHYSLMDSLTPAGGPLHTLDACWRGGGRLREFIRLWQRVWRIKTLLARVSPSHGTSASSGLYILILSQYQEEHARAYTDRLTTLSLSPANKGVTSMWDRAEYPVNHFVWCNRILSLHLSSCRISLDLNLHCCEVGTFADSRPAEP